MIKSPEWVLENNTHVEDSHLDFARTVFKGLTGRTKSLPCRYLYDAKGSALFERICKQPEYYLTRTESEILRRHAEEIPPITGPVKLAELGSGTSVKTRHILRAYAEQVASPHYIPVDVSASAMDEARRAIREELPGVTVTGILGPYEKAFTVLPGLSPIMMLFLGSTIGNFSEEDTATFLGRLGQHLSPDDHFLLGVDLVKDKAVLEAAYNDAAGVSAAFTLNLFGRMNRELNSDIDLQSLRHEAHFNAEKGRIEIGALFLEDQEIYLEPLDETVRVKAGEKVRTEISRKFRLTDLRILVEKAGFKIRRIFTDERDWFALLLLRRSIIDA